MSYQSDSAKAISANEEECHDPYIRSVYNRKLADIPCGSTFIMLNYKGLYMRVRTDPDYKLLTKYGNAEPKCFNDTGFHVPIVELATGALFYMSKRKPCREV